VTRQLAWAALCLSCAACAALWWPFGLIPAVMLLVLGTERLFERRRRRRDGEA
jgi:hypothetical protein